MVEVAKGARQGGSWRRTEKHKAEGSISWGQAYHHLDWVHSTRVKSWAHQQAPVNPALGEWDKRQEFCPSKSSPSNPSLLISVDLSWNLKSLS